MYNTTAALQKRNNFTPELFEGHDSKILFYTGLPSYLLLMKVSLFVSDYVPHQERNIRSKFEEVMVFLLRIRLNLPMQDIAHRFRVSQPTVSRICDKWLEVFYCRFHPLIRWPQNEELVKTMLLAFCENFGPKVSAVLRLS